MSSECANTGTNRLIHETSPYLIQHAHNPVDWYPWGDEAIAAAKREDKPIFLSIGYSACHWCHVMARECFENEKIAALMNTLYINIKVDREERPDIDEIYMKAVTALTGTGGWPLSVFLTPDLEPFFGATYLPPVRAYRRPSFPDVLIDLSQAYREKRELVIAHARELTRVIAGESHDVARGELSEPMFENSIARLKQTFDSEWGGFGGAPKFPQTGELRLSLRHFLRTQDQALRHVVTHTLNRMLSGGIHDQLGGGFHRYSVDREWRVPHFEKMLYDNALLISTFLEAYLLTRDPLYANVARSCCDWALSEMQTETGGFASAQDADSEGEEGSFFLWTHAQFVDALGTTLGKRTAAWFGVTEDGNFEGGKNVLWTPEPMTSVARRMGISAAELESNVMQAKALLLQKRKERPRPNTDDKAIVGWNGLMAGALAQAYQVLDEPRYLAAANRCVEFILGQMRQSDGRLFATHRLGRAQHNACLDDYAFLISALIDLYESDFNEQKLRDALALSEIVDSEFSDRGSDGYFTTGSNHEPLIARLRSVHDGALPNGSAIQALNLLRLSELTGRLELKQRARAALQSQSGLVNQYPQAFSHWLITLDFLLAPARQVVIAGEEGHPAVTAMLQCVRQTYRPQRVVALAKGDSSASLLPLTVDKHSGVTGARAYVCKHFACEAPADTADQLRESLFEPQKN